MFEINSVVSKQNMRTWDNKRPIDHNRTVSNTPRVMKWCATSNEIVMGLYFLGRKFYWRNLAMHFDQLYVSTVPITKRRISFSN